MAIEIVTKQKLSDEDEKFRAIFFGSEIPMVIFKGPEMVYEMFNQKYQEIYAGRELLGRPLLEVVPELLNTTFPKILKQVYDTGVHFVTHEAPASILNPNAGKLEERYFDTTFSRISFGNDGVFRILATPREVTERVLSRKKIEENLHELKLERELREQFIAALSHDLRTPLSISKMCAQIIQMKPDNLEDVKLMADKICNSVDRADRMIYNLLDSNRVKSGEAIPISINECRLDLVVNFVLNDLKEIYGSRFQIKDNKLVETVGYWDEMALQRLIENLAINAIKYGKANTMVTVGMTSTAQEVEISIHNEGDPIPAAQLDYLFKYRARSESVVESGQAGWGIGLALVKALVSAHKGSIRVESDEKSGTSFIICLPRDSRKNA